MIFPLALHQIDFDWGSHLVINDNDFYRFKVKNKRSNILI